MHRFLYITIFSLYAGQIFAAGIIQNLQLLIDQELYGQAARDGEQLLVSHSGHPDIEFLTAYAYQMNQQNREAAKHYKNLIRRHPDLPEPRNNLAIIYLSDGDYDRASNLLVNAINTHHSYATAYANLSSIYTGIASEAYRRALSESNEPVNYANKIELTALAALTTLQRGKMAVNISEPDLMENPAIRSTLVKRVMGWAQAWSEKDLDTYVSYYSTAHKLNFPTHEDWAEHRKQRILRPGFVKIGISNIQIRAQTKNLAIIDFEQSFDSLDYSDRVIKRLGLSRVNSQWKITDERVLSVL
jgi:tetratricopeptide (TPR) repeat protein